MRVDISELINKSIDEYKIEQELGSISSCSGVRFACTITNCSGSIIAKGSINFTYNGECARCLDDISFPMSLEFNEVLNDEDAHGGLEGAIFNLKQFAGSLILCSIPDKFLCRENCKGLCYLCGGNLNENDCNCSE